MKIPLKEIAALIFIVAVATSLRIGRPEVRLANASFDDHPSIFSRYALHPDRGVERAFSENAERFTRMSLLHSSILTVHKAFGISTDSLSLAATYLQNILLALALYSLARVLAPQPWSSVAIACFAFSAKPWTWNLAWYPSFMHSPYPGHFVLNLLIFSLAAYLTQRILLGSCLAILSALVHPSLALQNIFLLTLYHLCALRAQPRQKLLVPLLSLVPAALAAILPAILNFSKTESLMSAKELMPYVMKNGHFQPWTQPGVLEWALPTLVIITIFVWIAKRQIEPQAPRAMIEAGTLCMILAGLGQVIALKAEIIPALQLIPLRVTTIVALFYAVVAIWFVLKSYLTGNRLQRWSALIWLAVQSLLSSGVMWWAVLATASRRKYIPLLFAFGIFSWMLGLRLLYYEGQWDLHRALSAFLFPGGNASLPFLHQGVLVVITLVFAFLGVSHKNKLLAILATAIVVVTFSTFQEGASTKTGKLLDNYHAQLWARENTSPDAVFLVTHSEWRGISRRKTVNAHPFQWHLYTRDRNAEKTTLEMNKLLADQTVNSFEELPPAGIQAIANRYHADYFVTPPTAALPFRKVYENSNFSIYDIKTINTQTIVSDNRSSFGKGHP